MDRRSRSASRQNPHNHYNSNGMSSLQADYGNHYRHSTHFDNNGAPASMTNGLLLRPGGDSRTLSPDRRNNNESGGGAGYPMRGGSYNQYTMHRPAQPLTSLSHITGGGMGPPPPRPPTSSPPKSAPAPQTSPPPVPNGQPPPSSSSSGQPASVKYADEYSLSLKKASESTGPYANGRGGERIAWEFHHVQLSRVPGYGFGIAVSGGRDNPHFTNGDPSIAISDVLKAGPAEGKLQINDRVISANNISLEGVDYAGAVQVLRDSGQTVNLVVKRRVVLPNANASSSGLGEQTIRASLSKNKKKDDFGVVLGCKIYVKEITHRSLADKDGTVAEGDLVAKINGASIEGLTLKEARKLLDAAKDRLELVLKRDPLSAGVKKLSLAKLTNGYATATHKDELGGYAKSNLYNGVKSGGGYAEPPSRPPIPMEEGSDTLSGMTLPAEQNGGNGEAVNGALSESPDTPESTADNAGLSVPPAESDYGITGLRNSEGKGNLPDPRFISFKKAGSVGIRLTGGNEVGIFVTAVQPGSPAAQQGLQPGDKILKVNDMDMKSVTREEAVLFLLSLQDQINLIAQYRRDEYDQIVSLQRGDSFYIKAHFNNDAPEKSEMPFRKSDVFHVVDTLHDGVVGAWQAFRMDPFTANNSASATDQIKKGVIPNKARAEEIATRQFNAAKKEQSGTGTMSGEKSGKSESSFFRRRREKGHRRSKSLGKDHWEDLVWSESMSKFPAYERVALRHPGFPRPVVIFGPVADLARERLSRDFPAKFAMPQGDSTDPDSLGSKSTTTSKSGIVRLSAIRSTMDRGKHALLDVTPSAVDKLNYAQLYPIVVFTRTLSKSIVKECRSGVPKKSHLSSKKLLEQCSKLEKLWPHVFTTTLELESGDGWYNQLVDLLEKQQTAPIWMSETKPDESFFSDDFLFPMSANSGSGSTSRLSYTSGVESDGEFIDSTPTPRASRNTLTGPPTMIPTAQSTANLTRCSSDPNLADDDVADGNGNGGGRIPDYNAPPAYAVSPTAAPGGGKEEKRYNSDYGFTNGHRSSSSSTRRSGSQQPRDSVDELPLPPPPPSTAAPPFSHHPPQPNKSSTSSSSSPKEHSPPKIDRLKKPSRNRSATADSARVFHNGDNQERQSSNHNGYGKGSLDRNAHVRDLKMSTYDSTGSSGLYDNYNSVTNNGNGGTGPYSGTNGSSSGPYSSPVGNEGGYRSSRSSYGAAPSGNSNGYGDDRERYRYADYKPVPPPKTAIYKPVPPPKPKSFPPGSSGPNTPQRTQSQPPAVPSTPEGNYMNSGQVNGHYQSSHNQHHHGQYATSNGYQSSSTPSQNGHSGHRGYDDHTDSGQGSSLDRGDYDRGGGYGKPSIGHHHHQQRGPPPPPQNGHQQQYYYNLPQNQHQQQQPQSMPPSATPSKPDSGGLDLTGNREYRGSAFELYKKPMNGVQMSSMR